MVSWETEWAWLAFPWFREFCAYCGVFCAFFVHQDLHYVLPQLTALLRFVASHAFGGIRVG